MPSRAAPNEKRLRAPVTADVIASLVQADPAKVRVLAHCRKLVADGLAEWHTLESGDIRFRLRTGEIYLLEKTTITRIA